jgi:ATP-dependent Clp protease adaptor protein ClpS
MSDSDIRGGGNTENPNTGVVVKARPKTRKPAMYKVLMLNDDYTPMHFVVQVLQLFFSKGPDEATRIMLHVHNHGVGECGVFTYEVAETKVTLVMDFARKHQHPLQCVMEKK